MQQEEPKFETINLMDYFNIAWKRRWLIIIPTIILAALAGLWSFLLPKIWEVDALIIPSKFFTQTAEGAFTEILVAPPAQIASQISQKFYDSLIAAELNIDIREFPRIDAENLLNTNLVRVSVRDQDPERGRAILLSLFNHLKSDFDKKIDIEFNSINNQGEQTKNKILDHELNVNSHKIDKEKTRRDIEADKNKLAITEQRIVDIQEEMKSVKKRVTELDDLRRKAMSEKREGAETLALLLYSNEVQQNLRYMNTLEDNVSAERVNIQNLIYSIKSKELQLLQIDNQISQIQNTLSNAKNEIKLLEEKKNRIDYTQLIKDPTPSLSPVAPNKKMNVMIAALIGLIFSFGTAFFIESFEKQKRKSSIKA